MLRWLFAIGLVAAMFWSSYLTTGTTAVLLSILILLLAVFLYRRWSLLGFAVVLFGFLALLVWWLPAVLIGTEFGCRMTCANNLRQLVVALHQYHEVYRCFPPAYIVDKDGKPMHSWRALLLPFTGPDDLRKQYSFDEPWDGPHNRNLLHARPNIYACPSDWIAENATSTCYVAIVGPNAAWQGNNSRSLNDAAFRGKQSATILLAEVNNAGIAWTEPRDFSLTPPQTTEPSSSRVAISSPHARYNGPVFSDTPIVDVARADGSVRSVPTESFAANRLLEVGEAGDHALDNQWNRVAIGLDWYRCIGMAVWFVSVGLLLYLAVRGGARPTESAVETSE